MLVIRFGVSYANVALLTVVAYILVGIMGASPVSAEQLQFSKYSLGSEIKFEYEWKSSNSTSRSLSFSITNEDFQKLPESAPAYNPLLAQNAAQQALLRYAKTLDPRDARVSITRSGTTLNMKVSGTSESLINEVNEMLTTKHKEAQAQYLQDNYYVPFVTELGQEAIKHDHKRYALESAPLLMPIVDAIKRELSNPASAREFINFTLSWLQAIPYDTLESRVSSNGSGFAAPQQLLMNNLGDCDSKSTLFLALLKSYNPKLQATMVYLPNHALVGVRLKPAKEDITLNQQSDTFVLAEPTGPAQYQFGEVAPKSLVSIRNRQTKLELF
jgi:hypothetical protein